MIAGWRSPWTGEGWNLGTRTYRWDSSETGTIEWNSDIQAINDATPYNSTLSAAHPARVNVFPISDLRVRANIKPDSSGATAAITINARGVRFQANLGPDGTGISATRDGEAFISTSNKRPSLAAGEFTDVEFWHADQNLSLWINGKKIIEAPYDWEPTERYTRAATEGFDRIEPAEPSTIAEPSVSMTFANSPVTLTDVAAN